jgi:hypothetical protein
MMPRHATPTGPGIPARCATRTPTGGVPLDGLTPDEERSLTRLLDLVADQVTWLDAETTRAARQGRNAAADRWFDRATALRSALHEAVAVLAARFRLPYRALPLAPGEP